MDSLPLSCRSLSALTTWRFIRRHSGLPVIREHRAERVTSEHCLEILVGPAVFIVELSLLSDQMVARPTINH
jgi:hypothetical protein